MIAALCLGANGVFTAPPHLFGLAVAGRDGVAAIFDIFRKDIARALVVTGCPGVAALDRSWLLGIEQA